MDPTRDEPESQSSPPAGEEKAPIAEEENPSQLTGDDAHENAAQASEGSLEGGNAGDDDLRLGWRIPGLSGPESADSGAEQPAVDSEQRPTPEASPSSRPVAELGSAPPRSMADIPDNQRPSFLFFGVVAAVSLIADIGSKVWAEVVINERGFEPIPIIGDNLAITLAYNQGGAWGLLSTADPMLRKPFFLCVSAFAIFFIISLYSRLHPTQRALKWGLPLVLGGALGNLSDRITRSQVIDFIDYHGKWVMDLNAFVHKYVKTWAVTDHWPTFNIADVAICIGVGLMAVDMFTHRSRSVMHPQEESNVPPPSAEQAAQ